MKNYVLSTLFLLLLLSISCTTPNENAILLYNVNIIDVQDGSIDSNKAILIENDRIKTIGSFESLKKSASKQNQFDYSGKFVIPGLWDSHVHIDKLSKDPVHAEDMLSLYTLNGVTSIREMGGDWAIIKPMREKAKQSDLLPRILSAGPIFENKDYVDWIVEIDNDPEFRRQRISVSKPEQVPFLVDSVLGLGVDFLKVRTAASPDVFFELAKQSNIHNVKFSGHVEASIDLYEAVNSGINSLEHVDIFQLTGMSESKMDSVVNLMKSLNTAYCPTLMYYKKHRLDDKNEINAFLYDSTFASHPDRAFASASLLKKSQQAIRGAEGSPVPWKEMTPNFFKFGKKIARNDGIILAGTDGANALVLPGFSLLDELVLYNSELEMDNLQILQSATVNPAQFFEMDDLGLVKEGFIADLVVLDYNPLEDIHHMKNIHSVVKSGRLITNQEIEIRFNKIREYNMNH